MPEKKKPLHIFRAGTHTDASGRTLEFSEADLEATARAYDPARHEAPIVVGHPKDNSPAYGWIASLSAGAAGLAAVPAQVEPAFAEAVAAGRYKKISASFYHPESKANPAPGVWYLRHVGFLGAVPPAVKGLAPASFAGGEGDFVTVVFGEDGTGVPPSRSPGGAGPSYGEEVPHGFLSRLAGILRGFRDHIIDKDGLEVADKVLPAWELDWLQEDAAKAQVQPAMDDTPAYTENRNKEKIMPDQVKPETPPAAAPEMDARLKALEEREAAFAERLRKQEAADVIRQAVAAGRLTPAQSEGLAEFMASLQEEATVAFGEGEARKMLAPAAFFRDFLNRLPVQVDFAEKSAPDADAAIDGASPEEVARRAVMFRERLAKDGVTITTTEAVAAVKAGADKKEAA